MNDRKQTTFHWPEKQQKSSKIHPTIQTTELPPFTYSFETNNQEYYPKDVYYNLTSPVSLQYRESLNSAGSSLSRHSTVSSINTTCSFFSTETEPTSYFVPCNDNISTNSNNKKTDHHFVVPTFAMAGKHQAQVMQLLFNYEDLNAEKPKEEYERTLSWRISKESYIITLSQYTYDRTPVQNAYLLDLGRRLGITSILILVSLEEIHTIDILLDNLIKAINDKIDDDWWSRVILVIDQPLQDLTLRRKHILYHTMPEIQRKYQLSKPLSLLFLNSLNIQDKEYKLQCQEILFQMLDKHNQNGRYWILNDTCTSSSSSDEEDDLYQTVIEYIDGVRKKQPKKKNTILLRRQVQKLHSYDDDTAPPTPSP